MCISRLEFRCQQRQAPDEFYLLAYKYRRLSRRNEELPYRQGDGNIAFGRGQADARRDGPWVHRRAFSYAMTHLKYPLVMCSYHRAAGHLTAATMRYFCRSLLRRSPCFLPIAPAPYAGSIFERHFGSRWRRAAACADGKPPRPLPHHPFAAFERDGRFR